MSTGTLKVIKSPNGEGSAIAWDGKTVASSLLAGLAAEALIGEKNREYFLNYRSDAVEAGASDHTVHSGNGLNVMAAGGLCFSITTVSRAKMLL